MDLKEKRVSLLNTIEYHSYQLDEAEKELKLLVGTKQPKTADLYNGIEKFFTIEQEKGDYTFILGGDGRSQPWDEIRNGIIATIKLKEGIYLDDKQLKIVKDYVKENYNPDHIEL